MTEGVFVTQMSSSAGMNLRLTNYVGCDQLLFHERYSLPHVANTGHEIMHLIVSGTSETIFCYDTLF